MNMATQDALRYTRLPLSHGSGAIPAVGFGTLIPDPLATEQATKTALEVGFRHLDCAERYRNEEAVGDAMQAVFKAGMIRREDIFVTTKLWNTNHRPERVKPAFDASLRRLRLDYADCYLIHTPFAFRPGDEQDPRDELGQVIYDRGVTLIERWRALERLVDDGHCKAIGLSDVSLEKLREVVAAARIKPAVVQVESHPYLPEWDLLDFCREHGIVLIAFAALGHGVSPRVLASPSTTRRCRRWREPTGEPLSRSTNNPVWPSTTSPTSWAGSPATKRGNTLSATSVRISPRTVGWTSPSLSARSTRWPSNSASPRYPLTRCTSRRCDRTVGTLP
jgi:diketogulonate reductase-like aldo/keto reductase